MKFELVGSSKLRSPFLSHSERVQLFIYLQDGVGRLLVGKGGSGGVITMGEGTAVEGHHPSSVRTTTLNAHITLTKMPTSQSRVSRISLDTVLPRRLGDVGVQHVTTCFARSAWNMRRGCLRLALDSSVQSVHVT